jgi:hypothetical protein
MSNPGVRLLGRAAAALALAAVLTVSSGTAALAYSPNPSVRYALVDTDNCQRLGGTLTVISHPNGCEVPDSFDGTFFQKDPGGVALKLQLHTGAGMVAKVEFHPYGEYLWIYDTRDDSDTVYVWYSTNPESAGSGPHRGPVNGYNRLNLSIGDGTRVYVNVYDDADRFDWIEGAGGTATA